MERGVGDLIAVEWWDSESNPGGPWVDKDTDFHEKLTPVTTVGHVVQQCSHQLTIACSEAGPQWGGVITIPMMAVKRFGKIAVKWEDDDGQEESP